MLAFSATQNFGDVSAPIKSLDLRNKRDAATGTSFSVAGLT
jgi:hypothetical protein